MPAFVGHVYGAIDIPLDNISFRYVKSHLKNQMSVSNQRNQHCICTS